MVTLMLLINFLQKMRLVLCRSLLQMSKLMNTKNFKKHFKKGITPLLCALTFFNLCGIHVNAVESVESVFFNIEEPSIPERGGYVILMGDNGTAQLFYVQMTPYDYYPLDSEALVSAYEFIQVQVSVSSGRILFTFNSIGNTNVSGTNKPYNVGTVYTYNATNNEYQVRYNHGEYGTHSYEYRYDSWGGEITGIVLNGNFWAFNIQEGLKTNFNVVWGSNRPFLEKIDYSNSLLEDIRDSINPSSPSESPVDVSSSGITNVTNKEQELLNKNDSVSNDINNLQVDINPNAASVTWDLFNTAVMSNSKVFTMFISILTIGIIGLILNR